MGWVIMNKQKKLGILLLIFLSLMVLMCSNDNEDVILPRLRKIAKQSYIKDITIDTITFINSGTNIEECQVSPDLPKGLQIKVNNDTCILNGKPIVTAVAMDYTISGINKSGKYSIITNIEVILHQGSSWEQVDTDPVKDDIQNAPWSGRSGFGAIVYHDKMFILGGENSTNRLNDIWMSKDGIIWEQVDTDPATDGIQNAPWSGRSGFGTVVYHGKMFVLGGHNGTNYLNDIWMSKDSIIWKRIDTDLLTSGIQNAPWQARSDFGTVVYHNKMFVLGGYNGTNYLNNIWSSKDGVIWKRIDTNSATNGIQNAPWRARSGFGVVVHHDKMFVLGGLSKYSIHRIHLRDIWSSIDGTNWLEITSANTSWFTRSRHAVLSNKEDLLIFGGISFSNTLSNDIWMSKDGVIWKQIQVSSDRWSRRSNHRVLYHKGKLFMIGGYDGTDHSNEVWVTTR